MMGGLNWFLERQIEALLSKTILVEGDLKTIKLCFWRARLHPV